MTWGACGSAGCGMDGMDGMDGIDRRMVLTWKGIVVTFPSG